MLSARGLPASWTRIPRETYETLSTALRAKFPSISPYQPLSQETLSTKADKQNIYRRGCVGGRSWKLLACSAGALLLIAAIALYSREDGILSVIRPALKAGISKDEYIKAIMRDPLEGLFDPTPIREKCDATKFQEGLVWHCDTIVGGVGNVANMWLNCVRYAMEAGATTLILPRIGQRSNDLIHLGDASHSVDLSSLFDVSYFLDSWKLACPQIHAVASDTEVANLPPSADSPHISPSQVKKFPMRKYLVVDPTGWREAFDIWLAKQKGFEGMSAEKPVRVVQRFVLAEWNREVHPLNFANSFPRLFRYPLETRRLASSALWSLEKMMGRPVVAESVISSVAPSKVNSLGPGRLAPNGFMGAHLRVAADAAKAGWPGYESQAPFYLAEAKKLNLTTIYLATGSPEHRKRFRNESVTEGVDVVTKEELLDPEDLAELQSLSWDQQALVDYDVLIRSTWFYGAVRSSYSWSLAMRRGTLPEAGVENALGGDKRIDEYRDGLSAIIGRYGSINPEGLWP